MTIDLNCDVGELDNITLEDALLGLVTSANIACGGHAGDEKTMARTVAAARQLGVTLGAHPSYPDRAGFGRTELGLAPEAIEDFVFAQVSTLDAIAGGGLRHVKPHGALYHRCARDRAAAEALARGVARVRKDFRLVGPRAAVDAWRAAGFVALHEGFCDRAYELDGSLRKRGEPGALLASPEEAGAQAVRLARSGSFDTLCLHADTPDVVSLGVAVVSALRGAGIALAPPAQ